MYEARKRVRRAKKIMEEALNGPEKAGRQVVGQKNARTAYKEEETRTQEEVNCCFLVLCLL